MTSFTLIDGDATHSIDAAVIEGSVHLPPQALGTALGWELKPQGLCKGDVCVPVRNRNALVNADGVALDELARLLDRPLAVDTQEGVAVLGTSAGETGAQLASLEAPDFALPDLQGKMHRLSDYRGKKVLLIAYASW